MWLRVSDAAESSKLVAILRVDSFTDNSSMSNCDWGLLETSNKWGYNNKNWGKVYIVQLKLRHFLAHSSLRER